MKADTRLFGQIEIEPEKIIEMEQGLIGFPDLKHFTLIYDSEREQKSAIIWLQSMDDGDVAMPVMVPTDLIPDYQPTVNNELLEKLGNLTPENTFGNRQGSGKYRGYFRKLKGSDYYQYRLQQREPGNCRR